MKQQHSTRSQRHLPTADPDATFSIDPRRPPPRHTRAWVIVPILAGAAIAIMAALVLLRRPASLPHADEAALLAANAPAPKVWRFAPDPAIIVVLFPSLHAQALALDRVALFVERAGAPHDRVLDETAARAVITASHESFDDLYDGHDYRSADLARFFNDADRDAITLTQEERSLRALLTQAGALQADAGQALITLTTPGSFVLDAAGRTTILRHELSHGLYFTDPPYATYVTHWWGQVLTAVQRDAIKAFLAGEGYDTANADLMRNEGQAYLIHTADDRFFRPESVGLNDAQWRQLRAAFIADMPQGWLRDRAAQSVSGAGGTASTK